jgi:hypothetical protein
LASGTLLPRMRPAPRSTCQTGRPWRCSHGCERPQLLLSSPALSLPTSAGAYCGTSVSPFTIPQGRQSARGAAAHGRCCTHISYTCRSCHTVTSTGSLRHACGTYTHLVQRLCGRLPLRGGGLCPVHLCTRLLCRPDQNRGGSVTASVGLMTKPQYCKQSNPHSELVLQHDHRSRARAHAKPGLATAH